MPFINSTYDGALLHYVDYAPASNPPRFQPTDDPAKDCSKSDIVLVFIHGWPMSHRMYEHLMLALSEIYGVRCVASDRRGFGKSEWNGHERKDITYDTFAQDTVDLIEHTKIGKFYFVAASMGCGETLLAYLKMRDDISQQCQGFVWLGASLPFPLQTEKNPLAPSRELWDMILNGFRQDRVGFTRAAVPGVFGIPFNIGIELSETVLQKFEWVVAQADSLALERCVQIITNRDFTEDLRKLDSRDVKILVIHGDNDQSMPAEATANLVPQLAKQAQVKVYEKAAHGLYLTHADKVLEDVLAFVFGI
ncbi:uncharacterized protein Z518_02138 [Rhinocladiella mackenziei CBS 650.93]|uniref:AB hydrolase-1 domain-containing protein n=1 Tax=Rhinocladiella mackenziei CBS 650.93 TaxID=1442369 RepID=A0A0D2JE94_9EURO|nr:uncharacterized protein Z518_02138 [Rhinocladiella mackenziei CBS 650.93]KIX07485.1 hypothetical protein Z518_02138 [Rhinocladiella mackenziei CBS 650.93]